MAAEIRVDTITSRSGINTLSFIGDGFAFLTNVGIGTTITTNPVDASNTQKLAVGVVTANQVYSSTVNVGTGVTLYGSTGIVSATKFYGDGSSLTGAGSTVINDNTTNSTYYPLFTQTTSGTVTSSGISTSKLRFNPSTGILTATSLGGSLVNTLTLNTSGTGLSGSTSFNNSGAATFTVTSNATSANTVSAIVARDASGNFSAGTITASLSGNSSTASTLQTARSINGVSFNGSADITVNPTSGAFSNGQGAKVIQSGGTASGGSSGDIYYIY